jgi:two-component system, LytTR family, sensor kinase
MLLDLGLDGRPRGFVRAGYVLGFAAALLHIAEIRWPGLPIHQRTLWLTAAGFALLTAGGWLANRRPGRGRLAVMALVLFSLTFAHFHDEGAHAAWPLELAIHHAGIPLCLFVLAHDYRFLLLDAFIRFLANLVLAGLFTFAAWKGAMAAGWTAATMAASPRQPAFAALAACALLVLYAMARGSIQRALTQLVFRRAPLDATLSRLRTAQMDGEENYLQLAAAAIAAHFQALEWSWTADSAPGGAAIRVTAERTLHLGRRRGGMRYLSEDHAELAQLAAAAHERLEQFRESEMARLVSQAELRALQSQIHPHFLFNALNTLYGVIPREAQGARQAVLNLASIFRYFLRHGESTIALREEIGLVRAYLEIEQMRLGPKLRTEFEIDAAALDLRVPVLSLEPLAENAVRHGVAKLAEGGLVRVEARVENGELVVAVTDSGPGFAPDALEGVGLENVRRRLALGAGASASLELTRAGGATRAGFRIPLERASAVNP